MRTLLFLAVPGCVVGPKFVSVPLLESAPVTAHVAEEGSEPVEEDAPVSFGGTWTGTAYQQSGSRSWSLTVTFDAVHGHDVTAHAYYPDQHCRADWKVHEVNPRRWQGEENVTVDPFRRCPDKGRVTFEMVDDDTLSWRWTRQGDSATATLQRQTPDESAQP